MNLVGQDLISMLLSSLCQKAQFSFKQILSQLEVDCNVSAYEKANEQPSYDELCCVQKARMERWQP